jgi:hypothetical protein
MQAGNLGEMVDVWEHNMPFISRARDRIPEFKID